ncbi:MAG: type II toxin-antitoxin system RelE/ParE family toxin [Litorimonas sp.]
MRDIRYLSVAEDDLIRIYFHYAVERGVVDVADTIVDSIKASVQSTLPNSPAIGRPVESDTDGLRALLVQRSHWAVYTHGDHFVYIRRVLAAKELTSWNILE